MDLSDSYYIFEVLIAIGGILVTVWLTIRKQIKEPVEQLHNLQKQQTETRVTAVETDVKILKDDFHQLEKDRLMERQVLSALFHTEIDKLRDSSNTERVALHARLNELQMSVTRVDERCMATMDTLTDLNARFNEFGTQLTTTLNSVLTKNN